MHYLIKVTISYCFHDAWIAITWWFHTFFDNKTSCDAQYDLLIQLLVPILPPFHFIFVVWVCLRAFFGMSLSMRLHKWIIKGRGIPLMFYMRLMLHYYARSIIFGKVARKQLFFFLWNPWWTTSSTHICLWSWVLISNSHSHVNDFLYLIKVLHFDF